MLSGLRFLDDPLVSVSGQFPLNQCDFIPPSVSESPSEPSVRPYSLRWLVDLGLPAAPTSYRYCSVRQIAVDVVTGEPRPPLCKLDWTTREHKDGDEGPSTGKRFRTTTDR